MSLRRSAAALVLLGDEVRTHVEGWHRIEDRVRWASVSKVLTAGLAHLAVEAGEWSWETTAADVLCADVPPAVTVRALVSHASGLPRMLPAQHRSLLDPYRDWSTERFDADAVPRLAGLVDDDRLHNGEYSNLGYAVLTRMLELTSSTPWLALVRERLLAPHGLDPATVDVAVATGDRTDVVEARSLLGRPLGEWHVGTGPFVGAGGLVASLADMAALLSRAGTDGPLDPRLRPHAWEVIDGLAQHRGALMRSGAVAVLRPADGTVGVASAVGGTPSFADGAALRALETLVEEAP